MCVARLLGRLSRAGQSILKNLCFESEKNVLRTQMNLISPHKNRSINPLLQIAIKIDWFRGPKNYSYF